MSCNCSREVTYVRIKGDLRGKHLWIGQSFKMTAELSPPLLRSQGPTGGVVPVSTGHLQIRRYTFSHAATGGYEVDVTPAFRQTFSKKFTGRNTTSAGSPQGSVSLSDGTLQVLAPGKAKDTKVEIINQTFLPSWITGIEWEGIYETNSRRIG